jgi:hypothetical protein
MDAETRKLLKQAVDIASREAVANGRMDLDPESLTRRAWEADEQGFPEIGDALRKLRDDVVNHLLGEGWSLDRIEQAFYRTQTRR